MPTDLEYKLIHVNESTTYRVFIGNAAEEIVPGMLSITAEQPHTANRFDSHPESYCLIKTMDEPPVCLDLAVNKEATTNAVVSSVMTDHAFRQSWEIIFFPRYNSCLLRNGHKAFLKIVSETVEGQTTLFVGAGSGQTTEACYWELKKEPVDDVTIPFQFKLFNIKYGVYLKIGTSNNIITTNNPNDAKIWDFEISSTVPPP